jgi:hypothetical protein
MKYKGILLMKILSLKHTNIDFDENNRKYSQFLSRDIDNKKITNYKLTNVVYKFDLF